MIYQRETSMLVRVFNICYKYFKTMLMFKWLCNLQSGLVDTTFFFTFFVLYLIELIIKIIIEYILVA